MINVFTYLSIGFAGLKEAYNSAAPFDCFGTTASVSASIFAACKIAEGMKEISFLKVNVGLVAFFINLLILIGLLATSGFIVGIMLLAFGVSIVALNSVTAHRMKTAKRSEMAEVAENDEE